VLKFGWICSRGYGVMGVLSSWGLVAPKFSAPLANWYDFNNRLKVSSGVNRPVLVSRDFSLALYTSAGLAGSSVEAYNCQPGQWAQITRGQAERVPQNWECVTLMQIDPPGLQKIPLRSHQRTPFRTKKNRFPC